MSDLTLDQLVELALIADLAESGSEYRSKSNTRTALRIIGERLRAVLGEIARTEPAPTQLARVTEERDSARRLLAELHDKHYSERAQVREGQ